MNQPANGSAAPATSTSSSGTGRVHHRRLKERLANNREWIEFEGTSVRAENHGGYANFDDNVLDFPGAPTARVGPAILRPQVRAVVDLVARQPDAAGSRSIRLCEAASTRA